MAARAVDVPTVALESGKGSAQSSQGKASIAVKAGEAVPNVLSKVRKAPVALSVTRRWYSTSVVAAA